MNRARVVLEDYRLSLPDDRRTLFDRHTLQDIKFSAPIEGTTPKLLKRYAALCGWTLARAHAKTGKPSTISGYLGKTDAFDQAIGRFALAHADQTERDRCRALPGGYAG